MTKVVVIGTQWGDEGKGKIVDWLSEQADMVVRFQGGHNAGHTLVVDGQTYKLNLLPSGVVREGKVSVIGGGVVINPWQLSEEIARLNLKKTSTESLARSLVIADNAALILPLHQELDALREGRINEQAIGTTKLGIGPAYEDKIARRAIRVCDLGNPAWLEERLDALLRHHNSMRLGHGWPMTNSTHLFESLLEVAEWLLPLARPVWKILSGADQEGKKILFEGAQGAMLDIDHGTYPFVTSSNTVAAAARTGSGFSKIDYVLGLTKAYTTRVGGGPFPTEDHGDVAAHLGERGAEFGTVTARRRRCGWFDAVQVRQAIINSGIDGVALTKIDVLDGLEELKLCIGYRIQGEEYDYLPAAPWLQKDIEPIYETLPGWNNNTRGLTQLDAFPDQARRYIDRVAELIGSPVNLVSTSPRREHTIVIKNPFQG